MRSRLARNFRTNSVFPEPVGPQTIDVHGCSQGRSIARTGESIYASTTATNVAGMSLAKSAIRLDRGASHRGAREPTRRPYGSNAGRAATVLASSRVGHTARTRPRRLRGSLSATVGRAIRCVNRVACVVFFFFFSTACRSCSRTEGSSRVIQIYASRRRLCKSSTRSA